MSFVVNQQYEFIVIGGGSGGVRAARRAAGLGVKTLLFEKSRLGGTCVLKGCIPKKLMVYGSRLLEQVRLAQEYGWSVKASPQLDWEFQKKRREKELARLSGIYQKLLDQSGVDVIHEKASLTKEGFVSAGADTYKAPKILIAVGGAPYKLNIPGAEKTLVSDDVFTLEKQPSSLIVIGAGYIALEFAGIFQSLNTEVTLLCRGEKILRGFDEDVRSFLQEQVLVKGLKVINGFQPKRIIEKQNGFQVISSKGQLVKAEQVLTAAGRRADFQGLNLDSAGVHVVDKGLIRVSKNFETSVKGIYAIGDCADTPFQLTPTALAEAEVLVKHLFENKSAQVNYQYTPSAVFSNPETAFVGITEEQAVSKGIEFQVFESRFRPLKNTISPDKKDEKIYIKMIVDKKTDKVLGCHIVGEDAGEIIQGVAVALTAGAKKKDFNDTIGLHPSSAEELCTLRSPRP